MVNALDSMNSVAEILGTLPAEEMQHMLRVGGLVKRFCEGLTEGSPAGESPDALKRFGSAAFYHDIGKAWISPDLLCKPGRLTERERRIVRQHPLYARRLFERIALGRVSGIPHSLIRLSADAALYHHERWDGTGYPYGIGRGAIPLIARVTAICDAWDAMVSDRAYQKAHTRGYACLEIQRNTGTQFDPELARAFLSLEPRWRKTAPSGSGEPAAEGLRPDGRSVPGADRSFE